MGFSKSLKKKIAGKKRLTDAAPAGAAKSAHQKRGGLAKAWKSFLGSTLPVFLRGLWQLLWSHAARKKLFTTSTSIWGIGFEAFLQQNFYNADGSVRYDEYVRFYRE